MLRNISFTSKNDCGREERRCENLLADLHSHILPDLDDGSNSVEESLEMLRMARGNGVGLMIATPHFHPHLDTPEHFLEKRAQSVKMLSEAVKRERDGGAELPHIGLGAEVAFFKGMSRSSALESLCIEGTRLILIEMPFERWSDAVIDELFGIKSAYGLVPVVAHIDRYIQYQDKNSFSSIFSGDILIQINASAFESRKTRKKSLGLMAEGNVDFIGSDCHNLTDRSPNMREALAVIEKKLGSEAVEELVKFGSFALSDATVAI